MTDVLDHTSGSTSLTLTITVSKDGDAFGSITPTVTERGNGWYNLALTTSHTDTLGDLALHIEATGADDTDLLCRVVAGELDADISSRLATSGYTAPDNTGIAAIPTNPVLDNDPRLEYLDASISSRSTLIAQHVWEYAIRENTAGTRDVAIDAIQLGMDVMMEKIDLLENYDDTALQGLVNDLRKITGNKITKLGDILTIYEDNGSTIWKRYNTANGGRVII